MSRMWLVYNHSLLADKGVAKQRIKMIVLQMYTSAISHNGELNKSLLKLYLHEAKFAWMLHGQFSATKYYMYCVL